MALRTRPFAASNTKSWYGEDALANGSEEILEKSFSHAKLLLRTVLKREDYESLFLGTQVAHHSLSDVQRCVREAQAVYGARTGVATDPFSAISPSTTILASRSSDDTLRKALTKARRWLTGLSEKVVYFGNIFDVLVQHHPEYVALAWGTFKLVFVGIAEHAKVAAKLSKSIAQITTLLPQHSLQLILYPTPQMQLAVARLYAHILSFLVSSLQWYQENPLIHAVKAVFQPWDLKFAPLFESIEVESEQIRSLSDIALKTEVRDARLGIVQMSKDISALRTELQKMDNRNQDKILILEQKMSGGFDTITNNITHLRSDISRVHLNQMLSLPFWNPLPTSGGSLEYCRSMRRRRRGYARLPLLDIAKLSTWSARPNNALLLIDTYVPDVAKCMMIDMIDLILCHNLPVIWALRFTEYWNEKLSPADTIRMLVLQAMQLSAESLMNKPFPVTVEHLREASSLDDWISILNRFLIDTKVFVMLDTDILSYSTNYDRSGAQEVLESLRLKLSANVKIVAATLSVGRDYAEHVSRTAECSVIQAGDGRDRWRTRRRKMNNSRTKRAYKFRS